MQHKRGNCTENMSQPIVNVDEANQPIQYVADTLGGHGNDYQRRLAYYLIVEAMLNETPFQLTFEMKGAGKFDDVGLFVCGKWYLFQAKSSELGKSNTLTKDMLFGREKGDFALPKYFYHFKNMLDFRYGQTNWDHRNIENLILFTNKTINDPEFKQTSRCEIKLSDKYSLDLKEGQHIRLGDKEKELIEILEDDALEKDSEIIFKAVVKLFSTYELDPVLEKYKCFVKDLLTKECGGAKVVFNPQINAALKKKKSKSFKEESLLKLYQNLLKQFGDNHFDNIKVSKKVMGEFWADSHSDIEDKAQFNKDFSHLMKYICILFENSGKIDSIAISCLVKHRKILKDMFICDGDDVRFVKELDKSLPSNTLYERLRQTISTQHFKSMSVPKEKMGENFWTDSQGQIISDRELATLKDFLSKLVLFVGQPNVDVLKDLIITKLRCWVRTTVRPDHFGRMDSSVFKGLLNIVEKHFGEYEKKFTNNSKKEKDAFGEEDTRELFAKIKQQIQNEVEKTRKDSDELSQCYISRKMENGTSEAEFVQTLCISDKSKKSFILTAQPGMGKTTLMQSLAFETQNYGKENTEVFLIYLNNFRDEIPEINSLQDILDKNVFKSDQLSTENVKLLVENTDKQIFLFFDGFDEITERNEERILKDYKKEDNKSDENRKRILKLIDVLQSKGNIKIIISGRKNVQEELEKHLNVTSLELQAFSKNDQIDYFEKFWKIDAKNKLKFNEFASKVLEKLESDLSNQAQKTFIGVPLMTWMVAEIFAEPVERFLNSNVAFEKFITKHKFNIIYLFEKFIKTSSRIMINKKYNAEKNVVLDPVFGEVIKKTDYFYQVFAMEECFCFNVWAPPGILSFVTNREYHESLQIFKKQFQHYQSLVLEAFADRPRFTHLLFRDYFAAKFLFEACGRLNDNFFNVVSYLPRAGNVVLDFLLALINSSMDKDESEYNLMVATNNHLLLLERLKKEAILMSCQRDYLKIVEYLLPANDTFTIESIRDNKVKPLIQITFESGSKLVDQYLVGLLNQETHCKYPLHELVEINRLDLVEQFINENNINSINGTGETPLFLAKSVEMFELLIKHGANLGHTNYENDNIFHKLVNSVAETEFVKILHFAEEMRFPISKYINQYNHQGITVLHKVVIKREFSAELFKSLIEIGRADVNLPTKDGKTALDLAVRWDHVETVRYLIDECDAVNSDKFDKTRFHINIEERLLLNIDMDMDIDHMYFEEGETGTALHWAAKNNNLEAVKLLIGKNANINAQNEVGRTPLHEALEYNKWGRYDVAEFLIKENIPGIVYNVTDNQGENILHLAAKLHDKSFLEVLLKKISKSSLDEKNQDGKTALQIAVENGHESNVQLLLHYGANVDMSDLKKLLKSAEANPNCSIKMMLPIFKLIDQKLFENEVADLDCFDIKGQTALHLAAKYGFKNVLKHLIGKGTDVNKKNVQGQTPVHLACSKEIFDLLKSAGSVENINDLGENTGLHFAAKNCNMRQTALHLAMQNVMSYFDVRQENIEIAKLLFNNGANISLEDNHGKSEMIENCDSQKCEDLLFKHLLSGKCNNKLVEALLEKVGDVNTRDEKGRTFLHYAAGNFGDGVVKLLISKGADVNARDDFNNIPLHYAFFGDDRSVENVGYLADLISNINHKNNKGETPLHLTLQNRKPSAEKIAEILIAKNASIHLADSEGNTPLHLAILHRKKENALLLIKLLDPPELNRPNNKGETALQIAAEKEQESIVKLLLDSGANANIVFKKLLKRAEEKINEPYFDYDEILGTVRYLIKIIDHNKFANLNPSDLNGQTALHLAAKYGFKAVLKRLIDAGEKVDIENSDGQTPLLLARNKDIFEALIDFGASRNKKDVHGNTGLHIAVNYGNIKMVRYLIKINNCDIDCQNIMGKTALHLALSRQPNDFIFYVQFYKKASIRLADNEGNTPLHLAILHQRRDISLFLITHLPPSELNRRNNKGETALHYAVLTNNLSVEEKLVQKGVHLDLKTKKKKTALDLAKAHNFKKIFDF